MKRIFILTVIVFIFNFWIGKSEVSAQGSISCYALRSASAEECKTLTENCETGYVPPPGKCEQYAIDECPIILNCIPENITVTPRPTSTPAPLTCDKVGDKCCGSLPPLYCSAQSGLIPSDSNDVIGCTCQLPPTLPPSITPACGLRNMGCCTTADGIDYCLQNEGLPTYTDSSAFCRCGEGGIVLYQPSLKLCSNLEGDPLDETSQQGACIKCIENEGIPTALGCIKTNVSDFVASFFQIGLGLGGGIALFFLIYGGFLVLTSAGNPDTIKQGQEIITSAITGLLLIVFSVLLLRLISVDILKIPGFT